MLKYLSILVLLTGCSVRAIAVLETGNAISGKTEINKEQEQSEENDNLLGVSSMFPKL